MNLNRSLARMQPHALLLIRLTLGFAMVYHSWDKVYPADGLRAAWYHHHLLTSMEHFNDFVVHLGMPRWLGYVSTLTEFAGGLCLLAGLFTRFWAALVAINMLVALALVNVHGGYRGSEFSLSLLVMALLLVTTGAGSCALDRRIGLG